MDALIGSKADEQLVASAPTILFTNRLRKRTVFPALRFTLKVKTALAHLGIRGRRSSSAAGHEVWWRPPTSAWKGRHGGYGDVLPAIAVPAAARQNRRRPAASRCRCYAAVTPSRKTRGKLKHQQAEIDREYQRAFCLDGTPRRPLPEGERNHYSQRFSSRLALTPPKPKPFDSA